MRKGVGALFVGAVGGWRVSISVGKRVKLRVRQGVRRLPLPHRPRTRSCLEPAFGWMPASRYLRELWGTEADVSGKKPRLIFRVRGAELLGRRSGCTTSLLLKRRDLCRRLHLQPGFDGGATADTRRS